MTIARCLLVISVAISTAFGVSMGLGALSPNVYVVGAWSILCGLAVGFFASAVALMMRGDALGSCLGRRSGVAVALVSCAIGWGTFQLMEDQFYQQQFASLMLQRRAVAAGLQAPAAPEEAVFFAPETAEELDAFVLKSTGYSGLCGRLMIRAQEGVRLIGSWDKSRGLDVGASGRIAWAFVEWLGAAWVAAKVMARTREQARAQQVSQLGRPASAAELEDLDRQGEDHDGGA